MTSQHLSLLAEFHHSGDHEAAWRRPTAQPERFSDYAYYRDLARTAERGLFDTLFFADFHAFRPSFRHSASWGFEPTSLLAAVAAEVENIGIIATASTVYSQPLTLARTFATLWDQTGGRVGWNIVTAGADAAARSYGLDANPPHADRYRQAREFVNEVLDLWAADTFNLGTSATRRPHLVQAGSSADGRDFAGTFAETVFTATPDIESATAFRADVRSRAAAHGRDPGSVAVTPGFLVVLGSTEEEALRLRNELDDLLTPGIYANMLAGFGLSGFDLDAPLPERLSDIAELRAIRSRVPILERVAARLEQPATFRTLLRSIAGSRGHLTVTGTPEQVVDTMEEWFRRGAADGFVIKFSHNPGGADDFVDHVVPELQRRDLYRREYGADTSLRGRFTTTPPDAFGRADRNAAHPAAV